MPPLLSVSVSVSICLCLPFFIIVFWPPPSARQPHVSHHPQPHCIHPLSIPPSAVHLPASARAAGRRHYADPAYLLMSAAAPGRRDPTSLSIYDEVAHPPMKNPNHPTPRRRPLSRARAHVHILLSIPIPPPACTHAYTCSSTPGCMEPPTASHVVVAIAIAVALAVAHTPHPVSPYPLLPTAYCLLPTRLVHTHTHTHPPSRTSPPQVVHISQIPLAQSEVNTYAPPLHAC
ncbi:hypothetical protein BJ912DRAFT_986657 [Pholiota molesta]|nr:hypothetical protein BJ912DRAFT_986657 [Pholiota molesta]